ncbi:Ctr-domain-containing protein [Ascodesmis nigricans]|uniref:Copper transport protein n=1 Tax=Ascodesmis nigricans TaxID=341454 RepID=A0A4S2N0M0_9PEZI|nr:Ctr-domain-containing protein [Ascodesmis nigricans]
MADFTRNTGSSSSSSGSSHEGHNMGNMDNMGMSSMSSHSMIMTFFSSTKTPLFSDSWTPKSSGAYAGTCIFLIILAILLRALTAYKSVLEQRWAQRHARRNIVIAKRNSTGSQTDDEEEETRAVETFVGWGPKPWRWSVDLPRALFQVVLTGISYLLMLAVMTMNVGYFMSVLAGFFVGELAVGRYARGS